jgi:phospholipid/cholesterol/gamma-HCH transport system ATP-binding protein
MIEFKNVVKRFGDRTILKGISFQVLKGEILFILGTSGTGKSVTLKSIVGLLRPEEGEIWIEGKEVSHLTEEQYYPVRKMCGMVFQHPALFDSLTIFENVAFGLRKHEDLTEGEIATRVSRALDLVHLRGIEQKLPQDISYGMQKRVSLARTIAIEPHVLLFDEPTTGLDPVTTSAINKLILDLSRKLQTTSVVVSHDMKCALEIADRVLVLDQGLVIENALTKDLRNSKAPLVQDFLLEV